MLTTTTQPFIAMISTRSAAVRWLLGHKIDRVMKRAALVVAGNSYLADRARQAGAARVEILPTVVDLERYPPSLSHRGTNFVIGWIGSQSTYTLLAATASRYGAKLQLGRKLPYGW